MSVDVQVVFPQVMVPLNSVRFLPGVLPASVAITGEDFSSVAQVLLNDIESPDVVILSKTQLLAQVPAQLMNVNLTSASVISQALTMSARSRISFQLGTTPSKVSGILRLVQIFLKVLLTTPGRDIFAPRVGGNALKDVGLSFSSDNGGNVVADIYIAVDTTQKQITAIQARDPSIPRNERLLAAVVTAAAFNRNEGALIVTVQLTSQAGQAATANILV